MFPAVSHTRTVDPLHQLELALSVSTTSFRGPVVRSNGQRAEMRKSLNSCDLRQIDGSWRVKNDLRWQVFLTFHAESRRRGGESVFLRVSAPPRERFTPNLHPVHLHFGRGPYPAAHEIEDVRSAFLDRPRRLSIERIEDDDVDGSPRAYDREERRTPFGTCRRSEAATRPSPGLCAQDSKRASFPCS